MTLSLHHADDIAVAHYGTGRAAQLTAAAKAIAVICEQIGAPAALVLLNASIDAVADRLKVEQEKAAQANRGGEVT